MIGRWWAFRRQETGNVAIPFAISLIVLLGMGALVIDLGHLYVVKRQMQDACDAGACAGATALFVNSSGTTFQIPQWANGLTAATNAVQRCQVDGVTLSDFTATSTVTNPDGTTTTISNVERGYWSTTWSHGIPATSPANSHLLGYSSPSTYVPPLTPPYQYPAVKVTLAKTNGGTGTKAAITTYLASVLGMNTMEVSSSAVAARYYPSTIYNGFPGAVPKSMFHQVDGVLQPLDQYMPPNTFNISNTSTDPGQWTTYGSETDGTTDNGAKAIEDLITGANSTVSIGNTIWIPSGVKSAVYNTISDNCIYNSTTNSPIYMIPVAEVTGSTTLTTNNWATVDGFVAVKIKACTGAGAGGNPNYTCEFVPGYIDTKASGAGALYGTPLPTKLVN